jgi:hypothetical protein
MQVGEIVRALMAHHGLNFEGVAERVRAQGAKNVRYQHIQQLLEHPNRRPRYLPELARAFGLTVEDFLSYSTAGGGRLKDEAGTYMASHLLRIDPETIAGALRLVRLAFRNLGLEIDQEENGLPLAFAYQYLLDRQESTVTAENVIDFSARLRERMERRDDTSEQGGPGDAGSGDRQHGQGRKAS